MVGRRNAADLVSGALSARGRAKKERSLQRGAWLCQVIGALFVALAAIGALTGR
jgi:hypothetical protein